MKTKNYFCYPGLVFETVGIKRQIVLEPTTEEKTHVIIQAVLDTYGVSRVLIESKSREKQIRQARQVIHYLLRKYTDLSLAQCGLLTNRDHATAMHSVKTVKNDLTSDKTLNDNLNRIVEKIKKSILIKT